MINEKIFDSIFKKADNLPILPGVAINPKIAFEF